MAKEATTKNIYQRIIDVMSELDYIQKGDKMVNGQYRFVSHDQVTSAIHPFLVKHGICCIPTIEKTEQLGTRTEVTLRVRFVNIDKPDDFVESIWLGFGIDNGDKGPGKAISYAYKYAILKTFCLETGDDADNDAAVVVRLSKQQKEELVKALQGDGPLLKRVLDAYKIMDLQDLDPKLFDATLKRINAAHELKKQQQEQANG